MKGSSTPFQSTIQASSIMDIYKSYYQSIEKNNPSSLALFEKKIKALCNEVKDKILGKYFLDYYTQKINELTPNLNYKKKNFLKFKKPANPLQQTKDVYKLKNKFSEKQLKEFSLLFLIINNLDVFRKHVELISEINFSTDTLIEFKQKLNEYLMSEKFFNRKKIQLEDFEIKYQKTINFIYSNAMVKIIANNKNENEIIEMFNEIVSEIKTINLREKIKFLEDKASINLDEKLYSELLSLRNQLKGG